MRVILLAVLFSVSPALAVTNNPPTASLMLIPDAILPGTAVAFQVTVSNSTDHVQTIVNSLSLKVTSTSATFDAVGVRGQTAISIPPEQFPDRCGAVACLNVPVQSQRQLYVDIGPVFSGNEFFADRRLSLPGKYTLQLILRYSNNDGNGVAEIRTNGVTLTIQQPTGVDLAVWQFLQQVAGESSWTAANWMLSGNLVAPEIRAKYPSSAYIPWIGGMGRASSVDSDVADFDRALAMNPPASLRDDLLWYKAAYLAQASRDALNVDRDIDRALSLADAARQTYTILQRVAISEVMRQRATDGIAHLHTRRTAEETIRMLSASDPPAARKVVPRVDCVIRGGGSKFSARFGYLNPNKGIKVLPLGNLNEVTPAPVDQGQPHVFRAGDHSEIFAASSPGGELKWHLDGSVATATADFPTLCRP